MNQTVRRIVALAGVSAGVIAARRIATRQAGNGTAGQVPDRWHTVTVNRPPEEVAPEGRLPEPLAALGDTIEVRTRPAPGTGAPRWRPASARAPRPAGRRSSSFGPPCGRRSG
jgi:hypothetical protein